MLHLTTWMVKLNVLFLHVRSLWLLACDFFLLKFHPDLFASSLDTNAG